MKSQADLVAAAADLIDDVDSARGTVQPHATAIWYRNPGSAAALAGEAAIVTTAQFTGAFLWYNVVGCVV